MLNGVIKKMDEMEKDIALKSMRCGFLFTSIALVLWGFISINFETGNAWQIPVYILSAQNLILYISRQIYRKKMGDEGWKIDTKKFVITLIIVLLVALIIPIFFMVK